MKKIFSFLAAAAMLFSASCSNDDLGTDNGNEAQVTFNLGLEGQAGTRATIGDGKTVTDLHYAVFDEAGKRITTIGKVWTKNAFSETDRTESVSLKLAKDQTYSIVFWAQHKYAKYSINDNMVVTVDYANVKSNDEERDAFYAVEKIEKLAGSKQVNVTLRRPFAQLNVGVTNADYVAAENSGVKITQSYAKVTGVYNTLNLLSGAASNVDFDGVATFAMAETPKAANETLEVELNGTAGIQPEEQFAYLSMNYILVGKGLGAEAKDNVAVEFIFKDGVNNKQINFNSGLDAVPVERNFRTNLVGQILTGNLDFNVTIDKRFEGDENVEVWNGTSTKEPAKDPNDPNTYVIESADELAWLAQVVNGTLTKAAAGDSFEGKTFKLMNDVNLYGQEWAPIGNTSNPFKGTFDGNGKTVRNLKISGYNSNVGLFGFTTNGEIKNLTVENAKVSGRLNVAVVAGTPYTSKYSNITVTGHVEVSGMAYVGTVGGKNAYANWNNITVDVDETSYVKAHSIENSTAYRTYVGGVIGFMGEGGHTVSNVTSNINVKGSTIDVGGIVGIAHYGNKFENITCSGNVEIYAAAEQDEANEIGGIAGVWYNENGTNVTFTNCKFEGELKVNGNFSIPTKFGNLVCAAYNANGTGKLIIDGVEYMQTNDGVSVGENTMIVESNVQVQNALNGGKNVVLSSDIAVEKSQTGSNGYGATGISQTNGGVIDGNGNDISVNAWSTWDCAINTTGGTIKNVKVTGGMRGIFINHNSSNNSKVILENVVIDGPVYTISCDQGTNKGLEATNCTFNGWTSYTATIGDVKFTNCKFGEGQGYKFCRPYAPTEFVGCEFEEGFTLDNRAKVTFENCTLNGVAITAENVANLVTNTANATVK